MGLNERLRRAVLNEKVRLRELSHRLHLSNLKGRLKKMRAGWIAGALAIAIIAAGGAVAMSGKPKAAEDPAQSAKTEQKAPAMTAESNAEQLERVLRDESRDPEERIDAALELLEQSPPTAARLNDPFSDPWGLALSPLAADPWDPFRELQQIQLNMDRMFNDVFARIRADEAQGLRVADAEAVAWAPRGEFEETDDAYVYRFDLPGVEEGEVNVTVTEGRLIVEGRRQSRIERSEEETGAVRREIQFGEFRRVLPLPADVDPAAATVQTKLDEGVLTVTLPKSPQSE